jgi:hypothetical protein
MACASDNHSVMIEGLKLTDQLNSQLLVGSAPLLYFFESAAIRYSRRTA